MKSAPIDTNTASTNQQRRTQIPLAATLLAAMAAVSLLTTGVSALGPALSLDLDLTRAQFGGFSVVLFAVTAIFSVPFGRLVDVMSHRVGLILTFALTLLALAVLASAESFAGFIGSAIVGGAALAFSNPLTNRMVGLLADPGRRGSIIATKQTGPQISQIITATAYPAVGAALTWRAGFGFGGVLVAVVLALVLLWPLPQVRTGGDQRQVQSELAISRELTHPRRGLGVLTVYAVLSGAVYQSVFFSLPLFAHEQLNLQPELGALTGAVLGATGLVARLVWGSVADRLEKYTIALAAVGALTFGATLLFLASAVFGAAWALWIGAALFGVSGTAVVVLLTSALLRYYSPRHAGTASGILSMGTFAGFASGPLLFGALADSAGYVAAWAGVSAAAALASVLPFALGKQQPQKDLPSSHSAATRL